MTIETVSTKLTFPAYFVLDPWSFECFVKTAKENQKVRDADRIHRPMNLPVRVQKARRSKIADLRL